MKKEILKGFTMLLLIVGLALASAVVSANAQSPNGVRSKIPFEFVVGSKTLPAGEYTVKPANNQGAMIIQSLDGKDSAMRLSDETGRERSKKHARLVFHRYGQNYFLAEIWNGGDSTGRKLVKSRQERAIERELAMIPSKNDLAQSMYEIVEVVAVYR